MAQENEKQQEELNITEFLTGLDKKTKEAEENLAKAQKAIEDYKKQGGPYQGMLSSFEPKIDTEKETRLRDMGKYQAISDFLAALTSGVIGTAWKGYSPQVGANAQPYITELSKLKAINEARQDAYNKLKAQTELSIYENEGKELRANAEAAEKAVSDAKKEANDWLKVVYKSGEARKNAELKANAVAEARNKGKKLPYSIGVYDISPERLKTLRAKYGEWVEANVPAFEEIENELGILGEPVELRTQKTSISDDEFADWLNKNSRNPIIAAFLNNLAKDPESGVKINNGSKPTEIDFE